MIIPILAEKAAIDFDSSKIITALFVSVIITQEDSIPAKELTKQVRSKRIQQIFEMQKQHHKLVENQSDDNAKLPLKQINGKEVSSCLTVLPFEEHVFDLNKHEFWDADALWYNRNIFNLPSKCVPVVKMLM